MSRFQYEAYAEAMRGLAMLPTELRQEQQKVEADFLRRKEQLESAAGEQLEELERAEKLALEQFDEVAVEYKALFSVPVSGPQPVPTPLSIKDAAAAQKLLALRLKGCFDREKQAAVEKKRIQIEAEKAEQARLAARAVEEEEERRREREKAEWLREEAYRRQLEQENRSTVKKFFDFLTGQ